MTRSVRSGAACSLAVSSAMIWRISSSSVGIPDHSFH
jgi:hypothetical protein